MIHNPNTTHCRYPRLGKGASLVSVAAVYIAAVVIGLRTANLFAVNSLLLYTLVADVVATVVVFAFSTWYRNASTYDPFWSVIPMLIVLLWWAIPPDAMVVVARQAMVIGLVWAWGARLTWNWILRWRGLGDEDWRFGMLRRKHGAMYPLVNFGGIHMLPTLLVFAGCLATWPAIADSSRGLNWLDGLALLVTASAILVETLADRELRAHRRRADGTALSSGWWARCRHPNYLGELMFWWGLYLFALAANPAWWWTGVGALSIHLLFVFISVPMMDDYMVAKYPDYRSRIESLPAIFPALEK